MASTRRTSLASACARRSVDVSTRIERTAPLNGVAGGDCTSIRMDGRVRRSRGSEDRQTAQSQPIAGTPWEVPLPRTVTRIMVDGDLIADRFLGLDDALAGAADFDKAEAELVEHLFEHLALFGREVAPGLLIEQREDLDHLGSAVEVQLGGLAGDGVGQIAKMDRRRARQRQHEAGERKGLGHLIKITKCPTRHAL